MIHSTQDAFRHFIQNKHIFDNCNTVQEYIKKCEIKYMDNNVWFPESFKSFKLNPHYKGRRNLELPEAQCFKHLFSEIIFEKENPNPREYVFISDYKNSMVLNSKHYNDIEGKTLGFYKVYGKPSTKLKKYLSSFNANISRTSFSCIKKSCGTILILMNYSDRFYDTYISCFNRQRSELDCISLNTIEKYYVLESCHKPYAHKDVNVYKYA